MKSHEYIEAFEAFIHNPKLPDFPFSHTFQDIYGTELSLLKAQARRYAELAKAYQSRFGNYDVLFLRAPGRVDLLGSHTDYHEGYVLTMALDREMLIVAGQRNDRTLVLRNSDERFTPQEFVLEEHIPPSKPGDWANYVKAAAQAFVNVYGVSRIQGANLIVDGRAPYGIPPAAGLSSSSALLVASAKALAALSGIQIDPKQFALFCGQAEWYVGTRGGFMDHASSILSQKDTAFFLDCRPVEQDGKPTLSTGNIPMTPGYSVAICNTNVKKEKAASSDYNVRALECQLGMELLHRPFPQAKFLRDIPPEAPLHEWLPAASTFDDLCASLERASLEKLFEHYKVGRTQELHLLPRCRHVISENARVLDGRKYLNAGDMDAFGRVMTASYTSMRRDFDASCDELDAMIEIALTLPGIVGARIAGAGWGGCAVALVKTPEALTFQTQLAEQYFQRTGIQTNIFLCHPGQGASIVGEEKYES